MADYITRRVCVEIADGQQHEALEYLAAQRVCYPLPELYEQQRQTERQHSRARICKH